LITYHLSLSIQSLFLYKMDLSNIVKQSLQIEIDTLQDLYLSINDELVSIIEVINSIKGNIVITGIGKSAIIGQKFAATLNSTGSKSVFIHATDAIHGDLGFIKKEDVVICISKSGETNEIKYLIPHIKAKGICFIAMVSNKNSYLASQANHLIWIPVAKEADPNNLAPTASTTAQLVMCDCIAIALQTLRGFTSEDFAAYHPGGNLGKLLLTKVGDLTRKDNVPMVSTKTSVKDIIVSISEGRLGATVVMDESTICGIITDGDLRRMLQSSNFSFDLCAQDIMSINPKTIDENALASEAFHYMKNTSITQLIVVSNGRYKGVIHLHDLLNNGFD
jgi:arabinose-5-phosphate isomerase